MTTGPSGSGRPVVAVLFGGQSSEHEISCLSAGSVLAAIDRDRCDVIAVGITRDGRWVLADPDPQRYRLVEGVLPQVDPAWPVVSIEFAGHRALLSSGTERSAVDVAFPVLHGAYGEDGTVQGLLEMAGIPYVGSGVISSAMAMDKIVMKQMLERAGLPGVAWASVLPDDDIAAAVAGLSLPVFIKPARAGSSQGITKANDVKAVEQGVAVARRHDPRVIIEEGARAREIECAVLQLADGSLTTSLPAEIVVLGGHEFYDFEAKYLDGSTRLDVPAELTDDLVIRIREMAVEAFRALQCEGLARVDFFLTEQGDVLVNEVNTMPGFTPTSMYPLMWDQAGVTYAELVATLIDRALARPNTILR